MQEPQFEPRGWVIPWRQPEIERLVQTDPIVHAVAQRCLLAASSQEEFLRGCVVELARHNKLLQAELLKALQHQPRFVINERGLVYLARRGEAPNEPAAVDRQCTCDNATLMRDGCQCGGV